jgi:hypothetical protein
MAVEDSVLAKDSVTGLRKDWGRVPPYVQVCGRRMPCPESRASPLQRAARGIDAGSFLVQILVHSLAKLAR